MTRKFLAPEHATVSIPQMFVTLSVVMLSS
jgi:hypothetical protein